MNKITDCDWGKRMDLLVDLMEIYPNGKMKDLQREAMKYWPLYYNHSIRKWMSSNTGSHAAERLNKKQGLI